MGTKLEINTVVRKIIKKKTIRTRWRGEEIKDDEKKGKESRC
jgi:hypothetical protein